MSEAIGFVALATADRNFMGILNEHQIPRSGELTPAGYYWLYRPSKQHRLRFTDEPQWGWFRADHQGNPQAFTTPLWRLFRVNEHDARRVATLQKQIMAWPDPRFGNSLRAFQVYATDGALPKPVCHGCGRSDWRDDRGEMDVMTGEWTHRQCRGIRRVVVANDPIPVNRAGPAHVQVDFPPSSGDYGAPHHVIVAGVRDALRPDRPAPEPSVVSAFTPRRVRVRRST